eukprot:jgi/Ulvmu1/11368/UM075_0030.1
MQKNQNIAAQFQRQSQAQSRNTGKRSSTDVPREKPGAYSAKKPAQAVQGVTAVEQHILEQFDFDTKFGPCCGMTRIERWDRAQRFDLNPPPQVQQILTRLDSADDAQNCIWHGRV